MVPALFGIISFGIYKLFELFVCKKERLTLIEKLSDKFTPDMVGNKINFSTVSNTSFSALKFGCLFMGIGLGLLIGYLICQTTIDGLYSTERGNWSWEVRQTVGIIYGSSVLLCGGASLLIAFLVEQHYNRSGK